MTIQVLHKFELNENNIARILALYKQLNSIIVPRPLHQVLQEDNHVIFMVCKNDKEEIVGIALMATYKVVSGFRGLVEDVVVDEAYRGQGIGRKLMENLLEEAKRKSVDEILLFTGHHRTAAINLYKSLGFKIRESGVYNLNFRK